MDGAPRLQAWLTPGSLDHHTIIGDGTLHIEALGWMQHVGRIRLVTDRTHRHTGLGAPVARELVTITEDRQLEKLQAHVIEDNAVVVKRFKAAGFKPMAVLKDVLKDQHDKKRTPFIDGQRRV